MEIDFLESLGYKVTISTNSMAALRLFQKDPGIFDLIITDQTMPGMTGADMARWMIRVRPDIPIVLCTGYSSIITREKIRSIGIRELSFKPLLKKEIARLVRKALDGEPSIL